MNQAVLMINVSELKRTVEYRLTELGSKPPLPELARICFTEAQNDRVFMWSPQTEDERFRLACGALLLLIEGEDRDRVARELRALQAISAAMSGIPVDFESVFAGMDKGEAEAPIGLLKIFRDASNGISER